MTKNTTPSDPRVGEIQARSDYALTHESLAASDYAEMAWESARDVPHLLAQLRVRDEALARVEALADRLNTEAAYAAAGEHYAAEMNNGAALMARQSERDAYLTAERLIRTALDDKA